MKFRRMDEVVDAFRWTPDIPQQDDPTWATQDRRIEMVGVGSSRVAMKIVTPEGERTARRGDWIIKDGAGRIYPCKHEMFAAMYEPVTLTTA